MHARFCTLLGTAESDYRRPRVIYGSLRRCGVLVSAGAQNRFFRTFDDPRAYYQHHLASSGQVSMRARRCFFGSA
jgi:hypothetical protein